MSTTSKSQPVDQARLWLPPSKLRRYQWVKAIGGALVAMIFVGWLYIQWSNHVMRWFVIALLAITIWVVWVSVISDHFRAQGRQIALEDGLMTITAGHDATCVRLADVDYACWREDNEEQWGLWFFDAAGNTIAHLDAVFLRDQAEARAFLTWLRGGHRRRLEVRWP